VKLEAGAVGITAGSREAPGRNACDRRHTYRIIIIIRFLFIIMLNQKPYGQEQNSTTWGHK